jgi:hypothetical protein
LSGISGEARLDEALARLRTAFLQAPTDQVAQRPATVADAVVSAARMPDVGQPENMGFINQFLTSIRRKWHASWYG